MTDNLTYEKVKEIVTNNPDITAQEFGEKLKQSGTTDANICDLFMDIIRSGKDDTLNDRDTFLKTVELLVKSNIKIDIRDTTSNTVLDYAVVGGQPDVVKMLLGSGKFNEKERLHALNNTIAQGSVQKVEVLLDFVSHERKLEMLNETIRDQQLDEALRNKRAEVIKVLLDKDGFNEEEKINALSNASIDGNDLIVKLLLEYIDNIEISKASIMGILEIIKESKSPFEEELRTGSGFKVDFDNSDHCKYLSNRVITALLRSAINKKEEQNISDAEENNGIRFNNSNGNVSTGLTLNNDDIRSLFLDIDRITKQDNTVTSLEDLQKRLRRNKVDLQGKREQSAVLEHAIENGNLNVIKFLLKNGVTIINTIEEGRYYISKIKENESILCSVVSDTDGDNAEILSMLLQNINAEQSKLNPKSKLYRLYQQLKDDAFCTAFEKRNSVAAKVLIQNDQERIASCKSAVNDNKTPIATGTNHATIPPSLEEDKPKPSGNVDDKPAPSIPTEETNVGSTNTSSGGNNSHGFTNPQTSLRNDAVGVVITGLFIAAAVMVPSVAGAVICGIVAALALVATVIHVKDSTLPSYTAMKEVELTKQSYRIPANTEI